MLKNTINIAHSEAKQKLEKQIEEGKALVEEALHILKDTRPHTIVRTRERDNFVSLFEQWCDFTSDILSEIYMSLTYSQEFKKKNLAGVCK